MMNAELIANVQDFYNFSLEGLLRTIIYFALYSIVPLLIGFYCKKKLSEKVIAALMVLNSFVIYIAIIVVNIKFKLGLVPNMMPACIAGIFYYSWIRIRMHGKLEGKRHRVIREAAEAAAMAAEEAAAQLEAEAEAAMEAANKAANDVYRSAMP